MMKAAWYDRKGPARDVLQVGSVDTPEPGLQEVRVRVRASAVNPSDTKGRSGARGKTAMPFPRIIPHQDGAGVIDRVGEGVPASRVGERVWVYEAQLGRATGTAAEYVVVPAANAVTLPDNTSFAEGACLGIPAMTAHRCIFGDGPVQGQRILVAGGAGAVGFYAVQFAKWGGAASVIATVSRDAQAAAATSAGADHVINYRSENVAGRARDLTEGRGIDRIVDVAFGANLETSIAVLNPNGVISTYASDAVPEPKIPFWTILGKDITIHFVLVYAMPKSAHQRAAADITTCLSGNKLRHNIAKRFPLEEIAQAHEAVEKGDKIGNVIVEIAGAG
jgi:NADPH2:quinone reductase